MVLQGGSSITDHFLGKALIGICGFCVNLQLSPLGPGCPCALLTLDTRPRGGGSSFVCGAKEQAYKG